MAADLRGPVLVTYASPDSWYWPTKTRLAIYIPWSGGGYVAVRDDGTTRIKNADGTYKRFDTPEAAADAIGARLP